MIDTTKRFNFKQEVLDGAKIGYLSPLGDSHRAFTCGSSSHHSHGQCFRRSSIPFIAMPSLDFCISGSDI